MIANVHDRRSVEKIYLREAFDFDAGINSRRARRARLAASANGMVRPCSWPVSK